MEKILEQSEKIENFADNYREELKLSATQIVCVFLAINFEKIERKLPQAREL